MEKPTRKAFSEHANIEQMDWRLQAVTTTTADAVFQGKTFKSGAVVKGIAMVRYDSKVALSYGLPNVAAIMLDYAKSTFEQCSETLTLFDPPPTGSNVRPCQSDSDVIAFLEKRMAVVLFAFTALEAFSNEAIAGAYAGGYIYNALDAAGGTTAMTLEGVERYTSLDDKLTIVLPQIFGTKSIKSRVEWSNYKRIKKIRDRIVHNKRLDRIPSATKDETLWRFLADDDFKDFPKHVKQIIDYYWQPLDGDKTARWYEKCPW